MSAEVRAPFGGWTEVTEGQALRFAGHLAAHMNAVGDDAGRVRILRERIRGVTLEELADFDGDDPSGLLRALVGRAGE